MTLRGPEDRTHTQPLTKVLTAGWSRKRAYAGDTLTIFVRSEHIQAGSNVEVQILSTPRKAEITVVKDLVIAGDKAQKNVTIGWKDALDPADRSFVLEAVLSEDPTIRSPLSAPLWVDLELPALSF